MPNKGEFHLRNHIIYSKPVTFTRLRDNQTNVHTSSLQEVIIHPTNNTAAKSKQT